MQQPFDFAADRFAALIVAGLEVQDGVIDREPLQTP